MFYIMKKYNFLRINLTGALIMPESTLKYMANEKEQRENERKSLGSKSHSSHH